MPRLPMRRFRPVDHTSASRVLGLRGVSRLVAGLALPVVLVAGCTGGEEADPADSTPSTEQPAADPVLDDDAAAAAFFDAVVAGDRDAAAAVAEQPALDFFEPWEPSPDLTLAGPDENGVFFLSPGAAPYQCTVADGRVTGCLDEPTGDDEPLSDDEAATLLHEAVVKGDRSLAVGVAGDQVLDFFEPWEPSPDLSLAGPDENGVFFLSPGAAPYQCTVADGRVTECLDEPTGP